MDPFSTLTSTVVPLPMKDIDTDQIIPAQYLTQTGKGGYAEGLFQNLRNTDPDFPFSQQQFNGAQVLAVGSNFGCGSSREHAVWALLEWGFRAIIAPSFADIFLSNAGKNGLVLIQLPEEIVQEIMAQAAVRDYEVSIDLEKQIITLPDRAHEFPFDSFRKECILKGYDDLRYILAYQKEIQTYKEERQKQLTYSTLKPNHQYLSSSAN